MKTHVTLAVSTVACCLALAGCPSTVKVAVTNTTLSDISIVYASGHESKIGSGETREEAYDFQCLRVKSEGELYEFQPDQPPKEYYDQEGFNSSIYARFTPEKQFKIYLKGGNEMDVFGLKAGCNYKAPTGEYLRGAS
ncbi:hypothetical protein [Amphritea sp. HPY]|uniref:hypothetical protein n=1 Tax=Amphritea sp. HPY TaxID=3421652 RepID=UPI003D7C6AA6